MNISLIWTCMLIFFFERSLYAYTIGNYCRCVGFGTLSNQCPAVASDNDTTSRSFQDVCCYFAFVSSFWEEDFMFRAQEAHPECKNETFYSLQRQNGSTSENLDLVPSNCEDNRQPNWKQLDMKITDFRLLDGIYDFLGEAFEILIQIKLAPYPHDDWNDNEKHVPFDDMLFTLFIQLNIIYNGKGNFTTEFMNGLGKNITIDETAEIFLMLPSDRKTAFSLVCSSQNDLQTNLGFQFSCCSSIGQMSFSGMMSQAPMTMFPTFLKTTSKPPTQPRHLAIETLRVFKNSSIIFELSWRSPKRWNSSPKSYEVACKIYDPHSSFYHAKSCARCQTENSSSCDDCFKNTMIPSSDRLSPTILISKDWKESSHQFYIQTNLGFVHQGPKVTIQDMQMNSSVSYLIRYSGLNVTLSKQLQKLKNVLVLPGSSTRSELVSDSEIQRLYFLCAVRAVHVSGIKSEWSSAIKLNFKADKGPRDLFARVASIQVSAPYFGCGSTERSQKYSRSNLLSVASNGIFKLHYKNGGMLYGDQVDADRFQQYKQKCYHWVFRTWYSVFKDEDTQKMHFASCTREPCYTSSLDDWVKLKNLKLSGDSYSVKCLPFYPYVLWSEQKSPVLIRILQMKLDPISGQPLLADSKNGTRVWEFKSTPNRSQGEILCHCSKIKAITSGYFDMLQPDLNDFEKYQVTVICGNQACGSIFDYGSKNQSINVEIPLPKFGGKLKSIVSQSSTMWHALFEFNGTMVLYKGISDTAGIFHWENQKYLTETVPVKEHYRSTYSGFKAFVDYKKRLDDQTNNFKANPSITELVSRDIATSLPIPPSECMFPFPGEVTLKHVSYSTVEVTIEARWSTKIQCLRLAKPKIIYRLKYGPCKGNDSNGSQCNHAALSYMERSVEPTKKQQMTIEIGGLLHQKYFFVEVILCPDFDDVVRAVWYARNCNTKYGVYFMYYNRSMAAIIGSVSAALLIILLIVAIVMIVWMYNKTWYIYKSLERLNYRDIMKDVKLGEGHYGEVWKANLQHAGTFSKTESTIIVIKILKESATDYEEKAFREEALLMSRLNCVNIVSPLGICLQSRPIILALEHMNGGSLESYLRKTDVRAAIHGKDLCSIIQDLLKGCIFLEEQGILHRDIAARNALLQLEDRSLKPKIAKLSDFGNAKDSGYEIYKSRTPEKLEFPFAWTSPEAFNNHYSIKSDVWAFAVLIWESFSWGSNPFGQCELDNHICPLKHHSMPDIERLILQEDKSLADLPDPCIATFPSHLKRLMKWCWAKDPEERPNFPQLMKFFQKLRTELSDISFESGVAASQQVSSKERVSRSVSSCTIESPRPHMGEAYGQLTELHPDSAIEKDGEEIQLKSLPPARVPEQKKEPLRAMVYSQPLQPKDPFASGEGLNQSSEKLLKSKSEDHNVKLRIERVANY